MTLDEAIKHCLEVAEKNETEARRIGQQYEGTLLDREAKECRRCAADHRQLAEWLTELKEWKENPFRQIKIKCEENYYCCHCDLYNHCHQDSWNGYPMEWDLY